jgi:hypothetical protein
VVAPLTYNSLELYLRRPNWASAITNASSVLDNVVDNGYGVNHVTARRAHSTWVLEYTMLLESRAEIRNFKEFFGRCNGRRVPFYMPSWQSDINVTAIIGSGDTEFVASDTGYSSFEPLREARTHVFMLLKNGTYFCRKVLGASLDLGTGLITYTISGALGVGVNPADILICCWLHRVRQSSDSLVFTWSSSQVASVPLIVQLVDV